VEGCCHHLLLLLLLLLLLRSVLHTWCWTVFSGRTDQGLLVGEYTQTKPKKRDGLGNVEF